MSGSPGLGPGESFRAGHSSSGMGVDNAFSQEDIARVVRLFSSTSGVFSLKDAWRSRSRPSRPFSLGRSGAAYFYTLCCKAH